MISMEQAQELRKSGYWMVTDCSMDKVVGTFLSNDLAVAGKARKSDRVFAPLVKTTPVNVKECILIQDEINAAALLSDNLFEVF